MARISLSKSARVSPESMHPPLRSRVATGIVEVTLVVRHGSPLPTVEQLCADPPRRALTHEEFEAKYGLASKDLSAIQRFAKSHGLRVTSVQRDRCLVRLAGDAAAVRKALGVDLRRYQHGDASYLSHTQPVVLPRSLHGLVEWVLGLDTRPLVTHSMSALPVPVETAAQAGLRSYPPPEVARMYRYPATQGAGQCVGVIELTGGYRPEDLDAYLAWMGVEREPPVTVGPNKPTLSTASNAEVTMDVELVSALCPKARVVVYNAGSKDYSLTDYHRVLAMAISDRENLPSVLTTSWSFYEGSLIQQGDEAAFERLFREAALLGITVCAASGDLGSQVPVPGGSPTQAITLAATSYPAASALVLGCGGTTLQSAGGAILHERVWNRLGEVMSMGALGVSTSAGASSGGVSAMNALPLYQRGMNVPHQVMTSWTSGVFELVSFTPGRGVPDVAANADLHTGYQIYFKGQEGVAAGTSAAAPMWASLVVLLNEALGQRVGFLHPRLYALVAEGEPVVRRITHGGNGAFFASEDALWNACTGLGSPDGEALLKGLRKLRRRKH